MTQETTIADVPEDELDPWERPKPTAVVPVEPESIEPEELVAEEDIWKVQYPDPGRPPSSYDLKAREKRERFLSHLAMHGSPSKAAAHVGLGKRAVFLAAQKYPDFRAQWNIAREIYMEFIAEDEVRRRAIDGLLKDVWYQGRKVGKERVYDSGLAIAYLKANMPEKYTERKEIKTDISGKVGVVLLPVAVNDPGAWERKAISMQESQPMIDITPKEVNTDRSVVRDNEHKPSNVRIER